MRTEPGVGASCRQGFTLIEVLGALVIFSVGVLMVLKLTGALSAQMEYAAKASELVVRSEERLDSLEALPFASLASGATEDTVTIRGAIYRRSTVVAPVTGLLYQLQVSLDRVDGGEGPAFTVTSYAAAPW